MPRILCLHGHGTSSEIFENQLRGLEILLPKDYELVFADGEVECERAPGMPEAMPGPFLCYFNNFSFDDLKAAHDLLEVIIEEEGPFDGVFAFSQGASLTLSYLLELERRDPGIQPPFKFAVLFSPTVALSPDHNFCVDEVERINNDDFAIFDQAVLDASTSDELAHPQPKVDFTDPKVCIYQSELDRRKELLVASVGGILRAGVKTNFLSASDFQKYIAQQDRTIVPRVLHPSLLPERVHIPTVHVTGSKDDEDLQAQFQVMPFLCDPTSVKQVLHSGGHDLPRLPNEIKETVKAVEWAVEQSSLLFF